MRERIEPQANGLDCPLGASAPHERMQPGDQLDERERLGDIVVTACIETGDAIDERIARREEEHGCLDASRPNCLAEIASVGVGQADVDHEHIGPDVLDALERIRTVGNGFHA